MTQEARPRSRRMLRGAIAFAFLTLLWIILAAARGRTDWWLAAFFAVPMVVYGWLYFTRRN